LMAGLLDRTVVELRAALAPIVAERRP
jgi:hypothetical protein